MYAETPIAATEGANTMAAGQGIVGQRRRAWLCWRMLTPTPRARSRQKAFVRER